MRQHHLPPVPLEWIAQMWIVQRERFVQMVWIAQMWIVQRERFVQMVWIAQVCVDGADCSDVNCAEGEGSPGAELGPSSLLCERAFVLIAASLRSVLF